MTALRVIILVLLGLDAIIHLIVVTNYSDDAIEGLRYSRTGLVLGLLQSVLVFTLLIGWLN